MSTGESSRGVRLSKLAARRGLCSRREADRFIERGWLLVNGEPVTTLGTRVDEDSEITLAPAARHSQERLATVLLNKPVGVVSGQPERGYRAAVSLIIPANRWHRGDRTPARAGLAPAGRLDIDSQGLLVLTQDGRVAKRLVGEHSGVEKEYLVWVRGAVTPDKLERLRHGLALDGRPLRPAKIDRLDDVQLRFVLREGRKRQIRRMCEQVDLRVTRLLRVRIGRVRLGGLPPGKWRRLRPGERF